MTCKVLLGRTLWAPKVQPFVDAWLDTPDQHGNPQQLHMDEMYAAYLKWYLPRMDTYPYV
jgi:hypothetical protein